MRQRIDVQLWRRNLRGWEVLEATELDTIIKTTSLSVMHKKDKIGWEVVQGSYNTHMGYILLDRKEKLPGPWSSL